MDHSAEVLRLKKSSPWSSLQIKDRGIVIVFYFTVSRSNMSDFFPTVLIFGHVLAVRIIAAKYH